MPDRHAHWVNSTGGPLLLLGIDLLTSWDGVNTPADGRKITATFRFDPMRNPCDYDRAGDVANDVGSIEVAGGHGLVFGDEPHPATWIPANEGRGGLIARWVAADDERRLLERARTAPADVFAEPAVNFFVREPKLLLFDAAEPGSDIRGDALTITLNPGRYTVSTARYRPDPQTEMILHRFVQIEARSPNTLPSVPRPPG